MSASGTANSNSRADPVERLVRERRASARRRSPAPDGGGTASTRHRRAVQRSGASSAVAPRRAARTVERGGARRGDERTTVPSEMKHLGERRSARRRRGRRAATCSCARCDRLACLRAAASGRSTSSGHRRRARRRDAPSPRSRPPSRAANASVSRKRIGIVLIRPPAADSRCRAPSRSSRARTAGELLAQVADVDVDDVRAALERHVPRTVEQLVAREHRAGLAHEQLEQGELLRRKLELDVAAPHATAGGVEAELATSSVVGRSSARAGQRPKAREQLVERERLREVVVGARVEALDPILDGSRAVSISTGVQTSARAACGDGEAVEPGSITSSRITSTPSPAPSRQRPRPARRRRRRGPPRAGRARAGRRACLVFDYEDAHGRMVIAAR